MPNTNERGALPRGSADAENLVCRLLAELDHAGLNDTRLPSDLRGPGRIAVPEDNITAVIAGWRRSLAATAPNAGAPLADVAKMRAALRETEWVLREEDVYPLLHEMVCDALAAAPAQQAGAPLPDAAQLGRDVARWTGMEFTGYRGDTGQPEQRVTVSVERLGYAVEAILKAHLEAAPAPAGAPLPLAPSDELMKLSQFADTAARMSEPDMRNNLSTIADKLIALASTPQQALPLAPSEAQLCELEYVQEVLRQIAGGDSVVSGTIERIGDIRRARGVAAIAHRRLSAVVNALATPPQALPLAPSVPQGWRIDREPRNVLALHRTGTAQPYRFEPGEAVHALLSDLLGGCAECGGRLEHEDGEPWEGPTVGCVECGSSVAVGKVATTPPQATLPASEAVAKGYPPLPKPIDNDGYGTDYFDASDMRAFADAHLAATRAQPQADAAEPVAWEVWGPADRAWVRASKATYDACGLRSDFRRRALVPIEAQASSAAKKEGQP